MFIYNNIEENLAKHLPFMILSIKWLLKLYLPKVTIMHTETNYGLCRFIYNYIDQNFDDAKKYRDRYFAMYIFLLHKTLNVKVDYCKELASIYCGNFVLCAPGQTPDDIYEQIMETVVNFNEHFELCLREKRVDEETMLMHALSSVADAMLEYKIGPADRPSHIKLLTSMTDLISQVAGIFERLPGHHETLADFAARNSVDL